MAAVVGAAIVLLGSTAVALANTYPWGTYKGYPVVHVFVNGAQLHADVPAIIVNGRTMVSISYAARAIGGNAVWDGKDYAAQVTVPAAPAVLTDAQVLSALQAAVTSANQQGNDSWAIETQLIAGSPGTPAQATQAATDASATLSVERTLGALQVNTRSTAQTQALTDTLAYLGAVNEVESMVGAAAQDGSQGLTAKYQVGVVAANDADLWANTLQTGVTADFQALEDGR